MTKKNLFLISLILLIILTIGAVSAADDLSASSDLTVEDSGEAIATAPEESVLINENNGDSIADKGLSDPISNETANIAIDEKTTNDKAISEEDNSIYSKDKANVLRENETPVILTINAPNIYYGETANVTVSARYGAGPLANSSINLALDGAAGENILIFDDGIAQKNYTGLAAGNHAVVASFSGYGPYPSASASKSFEVLTPTVNIEIEANDIYYGERAYVTLHVTYGNQPFANNTIQVSLDGQSSTSFIVEDDGNIQVTYSNLALGSHTVSAYFSGYGPYPSASASKDFKVSKKETAVSLSVSNPQLDKGDELRFTPSVISNGFYVMANSYSIMVDGMSNYSYWTENGTYFLSTSSLSSGNHTLTVSYAGDASFLPSSANATFTVNSYKATLSLMMIETELYPGDDCYIFIDLYDSNTHQSIAANITVSVGNNSYLYPIRVNSSFNLPTDNLAPGVYNVTAFFDGNGLYDPETAVGTLTVLSKKETTLSLSISNPVLSIGDELRFIPSLTGDGSYIWGASYTIKVDGMGNQTCRLVNDTYFLSTSDFAIGNHALTVSYAGNGEYMPSSATGYFEVTPKKANLSLNMLSTELYPGDDCYLYIYLTDSNTHQSIAANITISVGNNSYPYPIRENSSFNLPTDNLAPGVYNVTAFYPGNDLYGPETAVETLTVMEENATIKTETYLSIIMASGDKYLGDNIPFSVSRTPSGVSLFGDNYIFSIDGVESQDIFYENFSYFIVTENLSLGNHNLTAYYPGDEMYLPSSASQNFTLISRPKSDVLLSIEANDTFIGEDATIIINMIDELGNPIDGANVYLYMDNKEFALPLVNGVAQFSYSNLSLGTYLVSALFNGTEYYNPANASASFEVLNANLTVTKDNFFQFFNNNGVLNTNATDLKFVGEFNDLGITSIKINKPVSIVGENANIINIPVIVSSDDVSLANIAFAYNGSEPIIYANNVANLEIINNAFSYKSPSDKSYAVNITKSENVTIIDNSFNVVGGNNTYGINIDAIGFEIDSNDIYVESTEYYASAININGPSSGNVLNNTINAYAPMMVYAINTDPSSGTLETSYRDNVIEGESYFAIGIYDDSETITGNEIKLTANYAIGIVALSESNIEDNKIKLDATNVGDEDVEDDEVDVQTAGIVIKNNVQVTGNNIDSSDASIAVVSGSSTINNNALNGHVTVGGDSSDNNIVNNIINTESEYAVELTTTTGNTVYNNEIHAADTVGNDAVNAENIGANTVEENNDWVNITNLILTVNDDSTEVTANLTDIWGNPISGIINVSLNGADPAECTVNETGLYVIPITQNSTVYASYINVDGSLSFDKIKVIVFNFPVEVLPNATIALTDLDGTVVANVTDLEGNAIANKLLAVTVNDIPVLGAQTDDEGIYSIDVVGNATVVVSYIDANGITVSSSIQIINNVETETGTIIIRPNATIALTNVDGTVVANVTDLDGNALANKLLTVTVNGASKLGAKTDENGIYSIDVDGNATVVVSYTDANGITVTSSINVVVNTVTETETLRPNATIGLERDGNVVIITLVDSDDNPISGADVVVYVNDIETLVDPTDSEGKTNVSFEGNATIEVIYLDDNLIAVSSSIEIINNTEVEIESETLRPNVTIGLERDGNVVIITLVDSDDNPISGADVVVYVNDIETLVDPTDSEGKTNVSFEGNATIEVIYLDDNLIAVSSSIEIINDTVEGETIIINPDATIKLHHVDNKVIVNLTDLEGHPLADKVIYVYVNYEEIEGAKTDENGLYSVDIEGNTSVIVTYVDPVGRRVTSSIDVVVNTETETETVVIRPNATIALTNVDGTVVANVTDLEGNAIANKLLTVTVNGAPKLGAQTDENGIYSVDVDGNATVVVSCTDDNGITVTSSIIVVNSTEIVEVEKIVNQTVEVEKIVYVNQTVEVPVEVEKIVYVNQTNNNTIEVEKIVYVNQTVEVPVEVEKIIYINNTVEVPVEVEKIVYVNETDNSTIGTEKIVYINQTVEKIVYVNQTVPIIPNRTATNIICDNMTTEAVATVDGRIGKYFEVTLVDADGNPLVNKPVAIGFSGKIYNRITNETGGVKLQINLGYKGSYTFAIAFLGDDDYNGSFAVANVKVTDQNAKLTASGKAYKASAKTKAVSATFKSANGNAISGKKISFTVNGKTYSATTNDKGVAKVNVSLNKKGTYTCTAKFTGNGMYKTTSTSFKVKIF
ncbi:Ig-like domain repeat protein [Methanobrevibacter ruminantium]|nr:Ig-like domain repeat protein [Methanobrevibacter ruminantium]